MSNNPEQSLRNRIEYNESQAKKYQDRAVKFREALSSMLAVDAAAASRVRAHASEQRSETGVSSDGG